MSRSVQLPVVSRFIISGACFSKSTSAACVRGGGGEGEASVYWEEVRQACGLGKRGGIGSSVCR
jgi:hypothetical protein